MIKLQDLPAINLKASVREKQPVGLRRNSRLSLQNKLFKEVSSTTLHASSTTGSRRNSLLQRQSSAITNSVKAVESPSRLKRQVSQVDRPKTSAVEANGVIEVSRSSAKKIASESKPLMPQDLSGHFYVSRGSTKNSAW